jgi:hypothetical protein
MKKQISLAVILSFVITLLPQTALAAGSIFTLNAWGGWAPNTTVTVQSTIYTDSKIGPSNLYYTIALGSTVYATHTTSQSGMNAYETRNDQWDTLNTGWPEGDYTISICWSTGNSQNCNIAGPRTTTVHFVPTLGWGLTVAALGLLLLVLWKRRREFEPAPERIRS